MPRKSCKENRGIMFQLVYEMVLCQQKGGSKSLDCRLKRSRNTRNLSILVLVKQMEGAEVAIHLAKKYGKQVASGSMA